MGKKDVTSLPQRQPILDALADSPDVESVVRLSVVADSDGHWVIAATVHIIDSLPIYALAAVLDDAKRRVREVAGETAEIYIEPELVKDPSRQDPPTDVIVIKASD